MSKLELEANLKNERKKLRDVLDGKGNAVLKDKIVQLEDKLTEL